VTAASAGQPGSPATTRGSSSRAHRIELPVRIPLWLVTVAVLTAAQVLRVRGAGAWRTVWAEDGTIFYKDALERGLGSLAEPAYGYLQTVPRLLALPATWFPMSDVALYNAVVAAACFTAAALVVYRLSEFAIPSRSLRATLVLIVCLHPVAIVELQNSITNVIWPLTFACFWAVLAPGSTRFNRVSAPIVVFLAAASQVLVVLFAPIAALIAWRRRDRHSLVVVGALGVGLLLQIVTIATSATGSRADSDVLDLPQLYAVRVVGSALLGHHALAAAWNDLGPVVAAMFAVAFVAGVLVLALRRANDARWIGLTAIGMSLLTFGVAMFWRGTTFAHLVEDDLTFEYSRFADLGVLLLLSGVFVLVANARWSEGAKRVVIGIIVVHSVLLVVVPPRYNTARSRGPVWAHGVSDARHACRQQPDDTIISIAVPPAATWIVKLRCGDVRSH
jgi:hypothetical protein